MRPVHALLLLSLAATTAVTSAEGGVRYSPDVTDGDMPMSPEKKIETATGLIAALANHFQPSRAMLSSFLGFDDADEVVRIVVIEQEEEDPAVERKTACLKAMEILHEQEELEQKTLVKHIHSAFDMVSLQVWGRPSCNDLDRSELVDQVRHLVEDVKKNWSCL
ncbi:unnamed protein product [Peronospora destructor]|uniref:Uncharacterized protein n=1 Tax=Peronospora destructor TaxID=86335 RepID=A0AAV0V7B4_9STRA|nr:unnamed protein product [Peronospora destructor]